MNFARLTRYGLLSVTGDDARDFLHAQLTSDVLHLQPERAALAGWCSPKGRLLASFLVVATRSPQGFLLQLARDLVPAVAKRLSMFVLRSKVKIADESDRWLQFGLWGDAPGIEAPQQPMGVSEKEGLVVVNVGDARFLALARDSSILDGKTTAVAESRWTLDEIRAGRPLITAATQDQFVPQMVNFEKLGGIDFQKGCYPGQEIVARAQYRGQVKRRMVRLQAPAGAELRPGQEFNGGIVVDSAGGELLAVMPV
jgi:tRNA-modifying protein YgfZ